MKGNEIADKHFYFVFWKTLDLIGGMEYNIRVVLLVFIEGINWGLMVDDTINDICNLALR